ADADRLTPRHGTETNVADIREHSTPSPTEYTDPCTPHLLLSATESAAAVTRAQIALAEMQARHEYDQLAEPEDRARWAQDNTAPAAQAGRDHDLVSGC
ncbi:MAG: hypothetical protein ACREMG_01910, partial [Gemmatimonadales bacterium]